MHENYNDFNINFNDEEPIKILEYNESNRVKIIKIGNKELSGIEVRKIFGLKYKGIPNFKSIEAINKTDFILD